MVYHKAMTGIKKFVERCCGGAARCRTRNKEDSGEKFMSAQKSGSHYLKRGTVSKKTMMFKRSVGFGLFIILAVFFVSSCGYYSFKGSLPSYIKSIAIPLFDNQTPDPGIPETLNQLLTTEFIKDNTLKVVDESKADLILSGVIMPIRLQPAVVREGEEVAEDKLIVSVKVKCEDVKTSKVLFNKTFQQYSPLDATAGLEEREQAINDALQLIAEDILNATLGAW